MTAVPGISSPQPLLPILTRDKYDWWSTLSLCLCS